MSENNKKRLFTGLFGKTSEEKFNKKLDKKRKQLVAYLKKLEKAKPLSAKLIQKKIDNLKEEIKKMALEKEDGKFKQVKDMIKTPEPVAQPEQPVQQPVQPVQQEASPFEHEQVAPQPPMQPQQSVQQPQYQQPPLQQPYQHPVQQPQQYGMGMEPMQSPQQQYEQMQDEVIPVSLILTNGETFPISIQGTYLQALLNDIDTAMNDQAVLKIPDAKFGINGRNILYYTF